MPTMRDARDIALYAKCRGVYTVWIVPRRFNQRVNGGERMTDRSKSGQNPHACTPSRLYLNLYSGRTQ